MPMKLAVLVVMVLATLGGIIVYQRLGERQEPVRAQTPAPTPTVGSQPPQLSRSAWLWATPLQLSDIRLQQLLDFAQEEKIGTLYIRMDDFIDIWELPDPGDKVAKLEEYNQAVEKVLTAAKSQGIEVEALVGHPGWADLNLNYIPGEVLNYVIEFNRNHPELQFRGIQFDVEVHQLPSFARNETGYLYDYLVLVELMAEKIKASKETRLRFGWAVPTWYLVGDRLKPLVWKGKPGPVAVHLLQLVRDLPGSYLAVMSYRDEATEVVAAAQPVLEYLAGNAPEIGAVVSIETAQTEEKGVSFYGQDAAAIRQAADTIALEFSTSPVYRGLGIHHLESFLDASRQP